MKHATARPRLTIGDALIGVSALVVVFGLVALAFVLMDEGDAVLALIAGSIGLVVGHRLRTSD